MGANALCAAFLPSSTGDNSDVGIFSGGDDQSLCCHRITLQEVR
jgi:hypothetical protein